MKKILPPPKLFAIKEKMLATAGKTVFVIRIRPKHHENFYLYLQQKFNQKIPIIKPLKFWGKIS